MRWMTLTAIAVSIGLAAAAAVPAQIDYESFPMLGTPIAGWTHHVAAWTVKDAGNLDLRAESAPSSGHTYLVRTGSLVPGGVVEAKLTGVTNTCNGGVVINFDSTLSTPNGVRAYGATSGGAAAYKVLILEGPGVARQLVNLATRSKNLQARVYMWGTNVRALFDVDPLDGKWDHELNATGAATGLRPYGAYAWNGSQADDVKFFDAVIWRQGIFGQPNLGTTVQLDLHAPTAGRPYLLIASFSKARIPVPGFPPGWFLPVVPDTLTSTAPLLPTIFAGFSGVLDASGAATAKINVPRVAALAGTAIHVTGVVYDSRLPVTYLSLFNDERIDLIP